MKSLPIRLLVAAAAAVLATACGDDDSSANGDRGVLLDLGMTEAEAECMLENTDLDAESLADALESPDSADADDLTAIGLATVDCVEDAVAHSVDDVGDDDGAGNEDAPDESGDDYASSTAYLGEQGLSDDEIACAVDLASELGADDTTLRAVAEDGPDPTDDLEVALADGFLDCI